jgi:hypothetical protein
MEFKNWIVMVQAGSLERMAWRRGGNTGSFAYAG